MDGASVLSCDDERGMCDVTLFDSPAGSAVNTFELRAVGRQQLFFAVGLLLGLADVAAGRIQQRLSGLTLGEALAPA